MSLDHALKKPDEVSGRLTGYHVLLGFLTFFLVIFAMNAVMIFKAVTTFGGLETDDAYRKGLAYNQRIKAAEAQAKLGWTVSNFQALSGNAGFKLEMRRSDGEPIGGLAIKGTIGRSATNKFDQTITMIEDLPGHYVAKTEQALLPGSWTADLTAVGREGETFSLRRRVWISP